MICVIPISLISLISVPIFLYSSLPFSVVGLLHVSTVERSCPEEALQMAWVTDTTHAAAVASRKHNGGGSEKTNSSTKAATLAPLDQYNYIIAPHRESLKLILYTSRTSSNVTDHSQSHAADDDVDSPDNIHTRRHSNISNNSSNGLNHAHEAAPRLDPVQSMGFDEDGHGEGDDYDGLSDEESDGFKNMMFSEF
jgi:hypothetical protein